VASLKDLRRRIKSVKNTKQITKAMQMVAASKLNKAQQAITNFRPYSEKLEEFVLEAAAENRAQELLKEDFEDKKEYAKEEVIVEEENIESEVEETTQNISLSNLTKENSSKKEAVLVISSDRGLCGSYNSNVSKESFNYVQNLEEQKADYEVYFVGKKAMQYYQVRGINGQIIEDFWKNSLTFELSSSVASKFSELYMDSKIGKLTVIFTEFKSAITQKVLMKSILPIKIEESKVEDKARELADSKKEDLNKVESKKEIDFLFAPSKKKLLKTLIPKHYESMFYRFFADSFASEMGSKMSSMDSATRNAGEMIQKLTLIRNRTRQAAITTELMEIIGGAEALKGK